MPTRLARPGWWPGRSAVVAHRGVVCTSQALATEAGVAMIRAGGNAVDAAIAAAATLAVTEPVSTGIGGDCFVIYWSAKDGKLKGLNGSGRCPSKLSWRTFARVGLKYIPDRGWKAVTVPGAVDAWWQLHRADGKLPWKALFEPAIHYAREGFPVSEIVAGHMERVEPLLQNDAARAIFLPGGKPVGYGQTFRNTDLAATFEAIAAGGAEAFYRGPIAQEILRCSDAEGGYFGPDDFKSHASTWVEPVRAHFQGLDIYELPPNGQGVAALIALNVLTHLDLGKLKDDWPALTHAAVEAVKIAYAERNAHFADPETNPAPLDNLISMTFAHRAAGTIDASKAQPRTKSLLGHEAGDTVYLCAGDGEGNLVSFINSLYMGIGSGVCAGKTGIMLQNRGAGFSLDESHPNHIAPGKRPFHTIIPGFALRNGKPHMAFGVMGGHHQAQGHVQFLVNLLVHEMGLQEALTAPRFDFRQENFVAFERDYPSEIIDALKAKGHRVVENETGPFGGAQAVRRLETGALEGASDPRKDGQAGGW
ncbi:MAG: gamma-glutamyltransferase [Planctomycetes bacterium]|nr:gamma-glutamyltransferase [Planctomycetota bacterium]